jgi:DNA-binding transcriptional MocR family regulator
VWSPRLSAYEDVEATVASVLLGDGRASLRSLAEELDVSVTTASNHLSDLEDEGVVRGYTSYRLRCCWVPPVLAETFGVICVDLTNSLTKTLTFGGRFEITE